MFCLGYCVPLNHQNFLMKWSEPWLAALPITSSAPIISLTPAQSVSCQLAAPGVSCGQLGCLFWTVYQLVLPPPLQLTLTAASPALPDSGSVTLSGRSRSPGVRDAHSPRLRSQRSPAPENRESLRGQRNIGVGSLGQASVPGSIWRQRERDGEPSPASKVWWPRWLLAVDCCCCCPLSPSNPLNTIMYPYSIIQPP